MKRCRRQRLNTRILDKKSMVRRLSYGQHQVGKGPRKPIGFLVKGVPGRRKKFDPFYLHPLLCQEQMVLDMTSCLPLHSYLTTNALETFVRHNTTLLYPGSASRV